MSSRTRHSATQLFEFAKGLYGRVVSLISFLLGIVALINFLQAGSEIGLSGIIAQIAEAYRKLIEFLLRWTHPYVEAIAQYIGHFFGVTLTLAPHWRQIVVPLLLYFSATAAANRRLVYKEDSEARRIGRARYACFLFYWGVAVGVITAVASACWPISSFSVVAVVVGGFFVFELISNLMVGVLVGFPGQSWWQTFLFHFMRRSLTNLAIAAVVGTVAVLAGARSASPAALVTAFVFFAAVRDLGVGWFIAGENRKPEETRIEKYLSLGSVRLGISVIVAIVAAVAALVWGGAVGNP